MTQTSRLEAEIGSGVTLYVGVRDGDSLTVVPQVVGVPLAQAKGRLWELGLNVGRIDFDEGVNLLNEKEARVFVQTPSAEREANLGSRVDLRLTLDEKKLARFRAEAEKLAAETAEERIRAERERDSLARAGAFDRPDTREERLPDTAAPASERQSPEQAEHRRPRTEPDEFFD